MGLSNSASHYSDQNMMNFLETFYFIHQTGYFIVVGSGKLLVTPSYSVDKGGLKDLEIAGLYKDLRLKDYPNLPNNLNPSSWGRGRD